MTHINSNMSRAVLLMVVLVVGLVVMGAEGRTQDGEFVQAAPAPSPSPTMDAGAAFLVTYSGAFVCSSLLLSLLALLSH